MPEMTYMTHRQRIQSTIAHQQPDRVALGAYSMTDVCYRNLRQYLGLQPLPMQYSGDISDVVTPHEDVMQHFDLDTRDVTFTTDTPRPSTWESDEYYEDSLGVGYRKHGAFYYFAVKHPLAGERTVADVQNYPWPQRDRGSHGALVERLRTMRAESDHALVMGVGGTMFATAWFLCGDDWFIDLATNAPFVDALMDKLLELQLEGTQSTLEAIGPDAIDIAICSADDFGMQSGLLLSPEHYRRFIKPRQRVFFDYVRSHSNAAIFHHCDGAIYPLIPDLIDLGVDILNPVQVECAGMDDTARLKREFGRDLTFWGAINIQQTLTFGSVQEVKDEVRRRMDDLAPGGGFILTPRWALRPEVPPQNICAIYEVVAEYA